MGHSDIRQMAPSAQLCLHYSHCSSKNRPETREKPAILVCMSECLQVNVYCLPMCIDKVVSTYVCVFTHAYCENFSLCVRVIVLRSLHLPGIMV